MSTRLWLDRWQGSGPPKGSFPLHLRASGRTRVCDFSCNSGGGPWHIPRSQALGHGKLAAWRELLREIGVYQVTSEPDLITWALEPSGKFSVRSLYKKLCQGTPRKQYSDLWRVVPLKIRVFLWQLVWRRHGPSSGRCIMCDNWEDTNHISFSCPLAKFMWSAVGELLERSWNLTCTVDVFRFLDRQSSHSKRVLSIYCAALL
jgi:hypothetical protein